MNPSEKWIHSLRQEDISGILWACQGCTERCVSKAVFVSPRPMVEAGQRDPDRSLYNNKCPWTPCWWSTAYRVGFPRSIGDRERQTDGTVKQEIITCRPVWGWLSGYCLLLEIRGIASTCSLPSVSPSHETTTHWRLLTNIMQDSCTSRATRYEILYPLSHPSVFFCLLDVGSCWQPAKEGIQDVTLPISFWGSRDVPRSHEIWNLSSQFWVCSPEVPSRVPTPDERNQLRWFRQRDGAVALLDLLTLSPTLSPATLRRKLIWAISFFQLLLTAHDDGWGLGGRLIGGSKRCLWAELLLDHDGVM